MLKIARKIVHILGYRRADRDLVDEMEFHRALTQQHLEESGVPPLDAACASRRALGNTTLAREDARAVWIWPWLESLWQDVVYALRSLRREPAFTLVALVALGGAIGLNTSLFTTINAFLWRPWPVRDVGRVVTLIDQNGRASFTLAERDYFARNSKTLSALIATRCLDGLSEGCMLKLDDEDIRVDFVTPNYFRVLGIGMARGAGFPEDSAPAEPIAILSDRAWRARFGADPEIVGRRITLDDVHFTVVGVAAPGFNGTSIDRKELWAPIGAMRSWAADRTGSPTRPRSSRETECGLRCVCRAHPKAERTML